MIIFYNLYIYYVNVVGGFFAVIINKYKFNWDCESIIKFDMNSNEFILFFKFGTFVLDYNLIILRCELNSNILDLWSYSLSNKSLDEIVDILKETELRKPELKEELNPKKEEEQHELKEELIPKIEEEHLGMYNIKRDILPYDFLNIEQKNEDNHLYYKSENERLLGLEDNHLDYNYPKTEPLIEELPYIKRKEKKNDFIESIHFKNIPLVFEDIVENSKIIIIISNSKNFGYAKEKYYEECERQRPKNSGTSNDMFFGIHHYIQRKIEELHSLKDKNAIFKLHETNIILNDSVPIWRIMKMSKSHYIQIDVIY